MDPGSSKTIRKIILGSASPRRRSLLEELGFSFEVHTADIAETYPPDLAGHQITDYLAIRKGEALQSHAAAGNLVLTADTIVWYEGEVMEKPQSQPEARDTLQKLSGQWHEVITSVCFRERDRQKVVHAVTRVKFAPLDRAMIDRYFRKGNPLDKAGAYGIQEWIGLAAVEEIRGSYTNVVGLPTQLVYKTLRDLGYPLQ